MTWGGEWDRAKVAERIGEALARGLCARDGHMELLLGELGEPVEPARLLNLAIKIFGRSKDYSILIAWANSHRPGALAFSEWCRAAGHKEAACRKRAERAADKLARLISDAGGLAEQVA